MDKDTFIANYLTKKLKNCKLPYGLQYLILRDDLEMKAENLYNQKYK
jgi:hypothetical protein